MKSKIIFCSIAELRDQLTPLIEEYFWVSTQIAERLYDTRINKHVNRWHANINILIEYPYVDRVYRDSYYKYFATKMTDYPRDCIRLSLFNGPVTPNEFRENLVIADLQQKYLGYMVLRPSQPNIVGRSMISPLALQTRQFLTLTSTASTTACSVKLMAEGFPHSSQDTETISCAETSVWAIMEYFASRYNEYKPALPSHIIEVLKDRFNVRQLPSGGLNMEHIAYAIKKFGFGPKIYDANQFGPIDFPRLLSCYIESGIPLIVALDNRPTGRIGHAVVWIGHSYITDAQVEALPVAKEQNAQLATLITNKKISIFDNDDIKKEYVIIDDNYPSYQLATFDKPTTYYTDPTWATCKITHFVAPLYTKVYLDAFEAKNHIKTLFLTLDFNFAPETSIFLRVFLASSRSYKDYLTQNAKMQPDIRDFILETPMPKFIWVGELSNKTLIKKQQAAGLVILGATEKDQSNYKALVFAGHGDRHYYQDSDNKELKKISVTLGVFTIYSNNLKSF